MRLTYSLHCKRADRQQCRLDSTGGGCDHAVHLLSALQSKPNVSHVISTRRSCGSLTVCIAKRAERQPCRLDSTEGRCGHAVHLHPALQASRTSAMSSRLDWRRVWSCGSLTSCIAKGAERQPCRLDSTGGGCGHAVHLLSTLQSERNVSRVVLTRLEAGAVMRLTYSLHCKRADCQQCRLVLSCLGGTRALYLLPALES